MGTTGYETYNLSYIVQRADEIGMPIIAASINYRKGAWGLLYSREMQGTGNTNLALRDMRKALAWIQENIASFGGNKSRVTIWGESAGSFAVGQLLLSYNGRTDGLFHQSIQESGSASTAWYNGSDWYQPLYDRIVRNANCSAAVDTLACLRTVPYTILYPLMNTSIAGDFYPTVDGDIIPNFPTQMLAEGRFAHVPHLYGTNSDEGTDNAPSGINTTEQMRQYLLHDSGFGFTESMVDKILELYPDDPALGIPLNTGNERFADHGFQYKRAAAIVGDVFYHAPRLDDARHYAQFSPTYIYRFNQRPFQDPNGTSLTSNLFPIYKGVAHGSEVSFVFNNTNDVGPPPNLQKLSERMSKLWISFAHTGNPGMEWPMYNTSPKGHNLVFQADKDYVEEDTYRLRGREYLTSISRRRHV